MIMTTVWYLLNFKWRKQWHMCKNICVKNRWQWNKTDKTQYLKILKTFGWLWHYISTTWLTLTVELTNKWTMEKTINVTFKLQAGVCVLTALKLDIGWWNILSQILIATPRTMKINEKKNSNIRRKDNKVVVQIN